MTEIYFDNKEYLETLLLKDENSFVRMDNYNYEFYELFNDLYKEKKYFDIKVDNNNLIIDTKTIKIPDEIATIYVIDNKEGYIVFGKMKKLTTKLKEINKLVGSSF